MNKLPNVIFVIHETIVDLEQVLILHEDSNYVASYHAVISYRGDITYLVPPEHKAFAAATSEFINPINGLVEEINGSVDDFAYHVALETPIDGRDSNKEKHSGYSLEQYNALAWLINATGILSSRVTTHGEIQTPTTTEPRCLNLQYVYTLKDAKNNNKSIDFGPFLKIEESQEDIDLENEQTLTKKTKA